MAILVNTIVRGNTDPRVIRNLKAEFPIHLDTEDKGLWIESKRGNAIHEALRKASDEYETLIEATHTFESERHTVNHHISYIQSFYCEEKKTLNYWVKEFDAPEGYDQYKLAATIIEALRVHDSIKLVDGGYLVHNNEDRKIPYELKLDDDYKIIATKQGFVIEVQVYERFEHWVEVMPFAKG